MSPMFMYVPCFYFLEHDNVPANSVLDRQLGGEARHVSLGGPDLQLLVEVEPDGNK